MHIAQVMIKETREKESQVVKCKKTWLVLIVTGQTYNEASHKWLKAIKQVSNQKYSGITGRSKNFRLQTYTALLLLLLL